jgi:hypothetical protein
LGEREEMGNIKEETKKQRRQKFKKDTDGWDDSVRLI